MDAVGLILLALLFCVGFFGAILLIEDYSILALFLLCLVGAIIATILLNIFL